MIEAIAKHIDSDELIRGYYTKEIDNNFKQKHFISFNWIDKKEVKVIKNEIDSLTIKYIIGKHKVSQKKLEEILDSYFSIDGNTFEAQVCSILVKDKDKIKSWKNK